MKKILFLLLLNSTFCFSQINLDHGLVAYYPFDGNANDVSGYNNNPSYNNAKLTKDRLGNESSAYNFNGTSSYMRIPNKKVLNISQKISISVWVRVLGFYQGKCHGNRIIMKGDTDFLEGSYFMTFDDNSITKGNNCYKDIVDEKNQTFYSQGVAANEYAVKKDIWQHLVYTDDGITAKFFVDCILRGTLNSTANTYANSYDLFFGKLNNPQYPYWFNGDMDEVRIYNRALSLDEVLALCDVKKVIQSTAPKIDFDYSIDKCNIVNFKLSKNENIKSLKWELGDNSFSNKEKFTHIYNKSGYYKIKVTAIGNDGKEIVLDDVVNIKKIKTDFTFQEGNNYQKINFKTKNNNTYKYTWYFGEGKKTKGENLASYTYKNDGNYTVTLYTENKNGCIDTTTKTITIKTPTPKKADEINIVKPTASDNSDIEARMKDVVKTIEVVNDSVQVSFYDNGVVDGDSVTVIFNNQIIVSHLLLNAKGKTFTLSIDKINDTNELIMYAENLGSIPPNTALMVIYDGKTRHEVNISSSTFSNGTVNFVFKKQ